MNQNKMRCRNCIYLNWDFLTQEQEDLKNATRFYCGLHGGSAVNLDGEQVNFDGVGSCGFCDKNKTIQLTLNL